MLDAHSQPIETRWNAARRADRTIHELLGLAKGIIADGVVSPEEALLLQNWIAANSEAAHMWPGDVLSQRLELIFADGIVDERERAELYDFLQDVTGERSFIEDGNSATRLPLDAPPPDLAFENQTYVFTGRFLYGTRSRCEQAVCKRGGLCENTITKRTTILVIGNLGSRHWAHTSFGRKIQKAVDYRTKDMQPRIIAEEHWTRFLI
jgi:NAD-dependent DNA ligase